MTYQGFRYALPMLVGEASHPGLVHLIKVVAVVTVVCLKCPTEVPLPTGEIRLIRHVLQDAELEGRCPVLVPSRLKMFVLVRSLHELSSMGGQAF
ncbi:MAG: hypothetical protein A2Y38_02815 [Spirochaetes bacterium GWB1_59_5]|nr:MAG: hypothetical protein A2Y38_02815 [Spirochaetes bacterium GWB1_59_5]